LNLDVCFIPLENKDRDSMRAVVDGFNVPQSWEIYWTATVVNDGVTVTGFFCLPVAQ